MGQSDWIKKEIEIELVNTFIDSFRLITGRSIVVTESSESPDFLAKINDECCGIEIAEIRMDCECDAYAYTAEAWRIAEKKHVSYSRHERFAIPIILVFFSSRPPLYELHHNLADMCLDDFDELGFAEVWFADLSDEYFSCRDPRRPADLFGVSPKEWRGFQRYGSWGRKPFG